MSGKLATEVLSWLKKTGYPLEMQVGREFRRMGVPIWQSPKYEDPRTHEPREIDVVATGAVHLDRWTIRLQFVVECKTSKQPWIVFGGDSGINRLNPNLFLAAANTEGGVLRDHIFAATDLIGTLPIFTMFPRSGYGLVQSFLDIKSPDSKSPKKSETRDLAYSATMQACGAAASLSLVTGVPRSGVQEGRRNATFSIPVVVLDGRLFEARLSKESEDAEVEELDLHCVYVQNPGVNAGGLMLHLLTKKAFPRYVEAAKKSLEALEEWCGSESNKTRFTGLAAELDLQEQRRQSVTTWTNWKPRVK
jgi:hypothetical protein